MVDPKRNPQTDEARREQDDQPWPDNHGRDVNEPSTWVWVLLVLVFAGLVTGAIVEFMP